MDNTMKSKQNPIPCKCEICDKEFKTVNGLKSHFNITHNLEKILQCNICQKVFNTQSQLTLHTKCVHKDKKNHKCHACGKQPVPDVMFTTIEPPVGNNGKANSHTSTNYLRAIF